MDNVSTVPLTYSDPRSWDDLARRLRQTHVPVPMGGFGHVRCEPGWSWRPKMTDYDLWFVIDGRGSGRFGNVPIDVAAGSLLVFRPDDVGSFGHDPSHPLTVISCHFDFVDPVSGQLRRLEDGWLPSRRIHVSDIATLAGPMAQLVRLRRDPHPLRQAEAAAMLFSVLAETYRQDARAHGHASTTNDPRIQRVVDKVQFQPGDRLSVGEAAAMTGLSPNYFSRLFTATMGQSFREYVLDVRLARARHLLSETAMTVSDVSEALGYSDPFLFSRQFRRRFGHAPSSARARTS